MVGKDFNTVHYDTDITGISQLTVNLSKEEGSVPIFQHKLPTDEMEETEKKGWKTI